MERNIIWHHSVPTGWKAEFHLRNFKGYVKLLEEKPLIEVNLC